MSHQFLWWSFSCQNQNLLLNGKLLPKRKVSLFVLLRLWFLNDLQHVISMLFMQSVFGLVLFCHFFTSSMPESCVILQAYRNGRKTRLYMMNSLEPGNADMGMIVQMMKMLFLSLRQNQLMVSDWTCLSSWTVFMFLLMAMYKV